MPDRRSASNDEFVLALRALDVSIFLDDAGSDGLLGREYAATMDDGAEVRVVRLTSELTAGLRNPDAFVRTVERYGYFGAGIAGGSLYLVDGEPRGEPLAARLAREGTLSPAVAAPIGAEAARQIQNLHRFGPHGCVTPATLFVDGARVAIRWPGVVPGLLAAGAKLETIVARLGMAGYVAPELAASTPIDARSDVFALGATLFAATTGRPPFGGRTTATTMAAVLTDGAPAANPTRRFTAAVLRAIERDPPDRWDDARRFAEAIEGVRASRPVAAQPARRGAHTAAAVGAILLGAILYLAWRLRH